MKLSYKIALIVSAALLLVAVLLIGGSGGTGDETTDTADNSTQTDQNQRKSLVSESSEAEDGGTTQDGSKTTANAEKPVGGGTSTPTSSLAADIRKYQQQAAAEKAASENAADKPADTQATTAEAEKPVDETAKANTPEAIALNRTDADAGKPVVTEEPKKTPTVSRAELEAILGGGSSTTTSGPGTPESTATSGANTSLTTNVTPIDTKPTTASGYAGGTYVIQAGDTFSLLADRFYGDESKWDVIAQANPRIDPIRLQVGQEVRIPAMADAAVVRDINEPENKPLPEGVKIHVVKAGDSLSSIAEEHYQDQTQWRKIYNFNRELIGKNPNAIKAGMELRIPPAVSGAR